VLGCLRYATYPAGYGVSRYWDIWSAACLSMLHVVCLMTREVDIGRFYHALPRDALGESNPLSARSIEGRRISKISPSISNVPLLCLKTFFILRLFQLPIPAMQAVEVRSITCFLLLSSSRPPVLPLYILFSYFKKAIKPVTTYSECMETICIVVTSHQRPYLSQLPAASGSFALLHAGFD
jgi:hypothetical protein